MNQSSSTGKLAGATGDLTLTSKENLTSGLFVETISASCITHPSQFLDLHRLCLFALRPAFPASLAGHYSWLLQALCRHRTRVP
jgi:hypothetical protein